MLKTLLAEVKEYKRASISTPIFMIGEVLMEMLVPLLIAGIVDKGVARGDVGAILKYGALMLLCAVGGLICGIGGAVFGARASTGFARNLRKSVFEKIQTFSFKNIDKFSTSGLITRLTTDITNIQNAYQMFLRMFFRAPISIIWALILSFTINRKIALIYLAAIFVLGTVLVIIMSKATKYFSQVFEKYDALNLSVGENISGIRVVKAYVREDFENSKFARAAESVYRLFVKAETHVITVMPIMTAIVYACLLLISWFGAHYIVISGELTTGELMSLLTYCMNIMMSLMMVAMVFVMFMMSIASGKRIAEVLNESPDIVNPENPIEHLDDGSIEFDHVNFSYDVSAKEKVLKDVSFRIESGETIGILGGTGSAKTSLVNLISRLYDATSGRVIVGGHDVRDYDLKELNNNVSVVLQKNVLFSGTVLDNLRWGNPEATKEDCIRACRIACADDFVSAHKDGYDRKLERGGTNVSGGQRQRLCIARALLKDPKILIFDDSTSAVDTATDAQIRKEMKNNLPGITKIIIAQRISSIEDADRVIVMDNGRIVGFDTPEKLLEENEIYRDVFETQKGCGDFDEVSAQRKAVSDIG
ncbi:MAG: ABC transporter ATP-binding protein [Lachnospiraceae bacterium]|jgi:ATP-binding cassette subfamily B multidrug efflux pump